MRKKTKKKKKRSFPIAAEKKEKKEVVEKVKEDWPEFRGLTDNEVEKKLRSLSSDRMLEIYKVLEMKIESEPKPNDEAFRPLTDEVAAKIFKA